MNSMGVASISGDFSLRSLIRFTHKCCTDFFLTGTVHLSYFLFAAHSKIYERFSIPECELRSLSRLLRKNPLSGTFVPWAAIGNWTRIESSTSSSNNHYTIAAMPAQTFARSIYSYFLAKSRECGSRASIASMMRRARSFVSFAWASCRLSHA